MTRWSVFSAFVVAAVLGFGAMMQGALAADLADDSYSRSGDASPYDDPRYAELYGRNGHRGSTSDRYGYDRVVPSEPVYKDRGYQSRGSFKDGDDYYVPDSKRYSSPYRHNGRRYSGCLLRHEIRRHLRGQGWSGFHRGRVQGDIAYVHAYRRGSDEAYKLAVDRCTGDIVSTTCVGGGGYDDVATRLGNDRRYDWN